MDEDKHIAGTPSPMDYQGLRDYGLEYIRKIGSRYWTDFNVHDPGVTILEALTLAVSDLSYRSSARMADLLTRKGGRQVSLEGTMFPADVILANAPTTEEDYRKLMLENIPGIRNIWFKPVEKTFGIPYVAKRLEFGTGHLKGCYHVLVELEDFGILFEKEWHFPVGVDESDHAPESVYLDKDNYEKLYRHAIKRLFLQHRNLCEEILDIQFIRPVQVGLSARLEIESGVDMLSILQKIYDRVYDYVSPTISFHTVGELLSSGRKPQDIFGVRTPSLGYIDREELAAFHRKRVLYISDIIAILMGIEGVRSVRMARFIVENTARGARVEVRDNGRILDISRAPDLSFALVPDFLRNRRLEMDVFVNSIVFSMNGLAFLPPTPQGEVGIRVKTKADERVPLPAGFSTAMPVPEGSYRGSDRYFSFQNLFPATYRMGMDTLPESAGNLRKAERLQLKAYLTFFDQILSDYLAQLDRFLDLLSVDAGNPSSGETYFHGRLTDDDIEDVSEVLFGYPDYFVPSESMMDNLTRKNEVLDHLLSRFAESFAEYASLEFIRSNASDIRVIRENVEDKKRFLGDYPRISALRSCGVDWTGKGMVSGAERRIMRRLGIDNPDARGRLSEGNELGLYVIEHSLLVPDSAEDRFLELTRSEDDVTLLPDPYTFRVTAVLPGWTDMTLNLNFRKYAEKIIREEIPAHIFVKVCWISQEVMGLFEEAYAAWFSVMKEGAGLSAGAAWKTRHTAAAGSLVQVMGQFANIYQEAVVMPEDVSDFDDGEDVSRMDYTYLGSEDAGHAIQKDKKQ